MKTKKIPFQFHQTPPPCVWGPPEKRCDKDGPGGFMGHTCHKPLDFDTLRRANVSRCEKSFHPCADWTATDWATAAAGELGEACNLIKKFRRGERISEIKLRRELADAVIYIDFIANHFGIDLGQAVREKFNLVSKRVGSEVRL